MHSMSRLGGEQDYCTSDGSRDTRGMSTEYPRQGTVKAPRCVVQWLILFVAVPGQAM